MDTRILFFDKSDRVRSGWRFAIFCIGFAFVTFVVGQVAALSVLYFSPQGDYLFLNGALLLFPALLVGWLSGRYLEGLPFRSLGAWFTEGWLRNLLAGVFMGGATLTLAVLIAFVFGGLQFAPNPVDGGVIAKGLVISFAIFAAGAAWEEALFRGYILQTFNRSGLAWLGIGLTSLFFGMIHLQNPSANVISTLNTMLAGVWFGVAYLKTRDLWFVWGIHLMWNWMQGSFFGIEVSGLTDLVSAPLLREIDTGPTWLTGETYGIEGGIAATLALIVSTVVIWWMPWLKPSEDMLTWSSSQNRER